jgi:hypothetical protein
VKETGNRPDDELFVIQPARGCMFSYEDVVHVIAPELQRIAVELGVDRRQLTVRQAVGLLLKDRSSPLWRFINEDAEKAMSAWLYKQVGDIVRSVRYVRIDIPNLKPQVLYVYIDKFGPRGDGDPGRVRVDVRDVYDKPDTAKLIADGKVRAVRAAHNALYSWAASSATPHIYRVLADKITDALDEFDAAVTTLGGAPGSHVKRPKSKKRR